MKKGIIYILRNKVNNKLYIGQTIRKFKKRFRGHLDSSCNMLIARAIRKHGKDNFNKYIFYIPIKILDIIEKILIKILNTKHPNGYNLTGGGNKGKNYSKITKERMSKAKKGKKLSKERIKKIKKLWQDPKYKNHMSKIHMGQKAWNKGRYIRKRIIKICPGCKLEFETIEGPQEKKFCSKKCYGVYYSGKNNVSKRKDIRKKISKGKIGKTSPLKGKLLIQRIKSKCENCGESIIYRRKDKRRFCSRKCYNDYCSNPNNKNNKDIILKKLRMSNSAKNKIISIETRKKLSERTKAYWKRKKEGIA